MKNSSSKKAMQGLGRASWIRLDRAGQLALFEIIPKNTPPEYCVEAGKTRHDGIHRLLQDYG
ncbi:MAG: hypothetical protein GX034_04620, partial [Clostridiaceae bacterium]|nr:hypothetical protein [Clostridiaceae bacterium]